MDLKNQEQLRRPTRRLCKRFAALWYGSRVANRHRADECFNTTMTMFKAIRE
jgi:hypothetical protein